MKEEIQPDGSKKMVINFNHSKLIFAGLIALQDPYKNRLKMCMQEFKRSGIRT